MCTSYKILKYNTITGLQMTTAAMTTTMHHHHSNQQCEGGWANSYKHLPHRGVMMTMMMIQTVQMMIRSHMCLWGVARGFPLVEGKCCVVNRELFLIAIIDGLVEFMYF